MTNSDIPTIINQRFLYRTVAIKAIAKKIVLDFIYMAYPTITSINKSKATRKNLLLNFLYNSIDDTIPPKKRTSNAISLLNSPIGLSCLTICKIIIIKLITQPLTQETQKTIFSFSIAAVFRTAKYKYTDDIKIPTSRYDCARLYKYTAQTIATAKTTKSPLWKQLFFLL